MGGRAKQLFRILVLVLVAWGIWQCVRNSILDLSKQQARLTAEATDLREQAETVADPEERETLLLEAEAREQQSQNFWKASPPWLLAASAFYVLAMLPAALFWRRCLIALEQTDHLLDTIWAFFYGNLGKYFPGKAMVFVLRVGALQHHGVKKTATALTIFMETLTNMAVGGWIAALCLLLLDVDWRLTLLAGGLLVTTFIPASPPVMRFVLPKIQKGVDGETLRHWTSRISWPLFLRGWGTLTFCWVANGFSLMCVLQSLPSAQLEGVDFLTLYLSCCGACALAVVLGFVSLLPGGAGVREIVLSMVLTPVVGPVAALCCAVWMRITWLATELGCAGFLAFLRWSQASRL